MINYPLLRPENRHDLGLPIADNFPEPFTPLDCLFERVGIYHGKAGREFL